MGLRVGIGYDVHRLVPHRKLILGGVEVPYEMGLLGHSDADVLTHAIMDAVIGALGMGDIGRHFPDNDHRYKDISSMELLKEVKLLKDKKGCRYRIINIDSVIVAQRPKLSPYIPRMEEQVAAALQINKEDINIKATTEEGLGFTGSGGGISAKAVVLLEIIHG